MPAGVAAKSVITLNCPPKFMGSGEIHRFKAECFVTVDNTTNALFVAGIQLELKDGRDVIESSDHSLDVGATQEVSGSFLLETDYRCASGDKIIIMRLKVFDKSNPSDVLHQNWKDCQFLVQ